MKRLYFCFVLSMLSVVARAEENPESPVLTETQQRAAHEAKNHGCPVSEGEEIVCGNIMCDFGALFGEWPDKCWDYKAKLTILKAKLKPWEKLPRCYKRDENCNRAGRAGKEQLDSSYCMDNAETEQDKEICLGAMTETDENYCGSLKNDMERRACEELKTTGKLSEEFCNDLAQEKAGIKFEFRLWGRTHVRTQEWDNLSEQQQAIYTQAFNECMALNAY